MGGLPKCFGVLGDPVAHSLSPAMHAAGFAELGLPHRYLAFHVTPAELERAIAGAAALGFGGLNVTVPHKQAAFRHCGSVSDRARRVGAVNTLGFVGGEIQGENTDATGFAAALAELDEGAFGAQRAPGRTIVLGSGGAARAVVDALAFELADPDVRWVSRAPGALDCPPGVLAIDYAAMGSAPLAADLLVNATTVGMPDGPARFPVELRVDTLLPDARLIDLVYPRPRGGLLDRAEDAGVRGQDGLSMLLWQGVRSLETWLDTQLSPPVVRAMRAALAG